MYIVNWICIKNFPHHITKGILKDVLDKLRAVIISSLGLFKWLNNNVVRQEALKSTT